MSALLKVGLTVVTLVGTALGIKVFTDHYVYDEDGYNSLGFDREGYNREGFDKNGYSRQGYDAAGYNREGFNAEGYNAAGYDRNGFNQEGWNEYGFNKMGLDQEGYNTSGYDKHGFNRQGLDLGQQSQDYYCERVSELTTNLSRARIQMKQRNFAYALRDVRVGMEKGIACILLHKAGSGYEDNTLDRNISACERNGIFDSYYIERLRSAKNHCNDTLHADCEKDYNQVYFCYKTLEEIIDTLQIMTGIIEPTYED